MKFKVSPKDLLTFILFCIILLYFCAIALLNVLSLVNDGVFYGFNPIEAFTFKYIFGTLLIFFAVLITVFVSVSSSIFSHQKGLGFGLSFGEKEDKGYSRWLKEKEMKKAPNVYKVNVKEAKADHAGVVLMNDGKDMWVDDGESHTLVMGTTGSGKTTAVVDPLIYSLIKHSESMVITDPKGEIYKNHAELLKREGYNIVVLNFRNPDLGNSWNPITMPYRLYKEGNVDKATELINDVGLNILQDKKAADPFWNNSAADYFAGCALGLLEDATEEEANLNSISYMTTVGEEKMGPGATYIKEYFTMKGEQSSAYTFASNTINSPTETKGGILSVFRQKIRIFSSQKNLSEMLSHSDFDMRMIGKEKTAVFMVIHDEKTTYHALATIFIKQCYETLIDVAQECGGKLPYRTNFILDEFANMPPLKDVTTMVTAARSRQIRFTFIIQNFAQLNEVYGKEDAETIRSNCGNLIYILTTELAALEEISKLCGEVKSKDKDHPGNVPLVTVSDLQKLKMNEVIIIRHRQHPFKTSLKPSYDIDWGDQDVGKSEFFTREIKEIQLFDIKKHVDLRKKSKKEDKPNPFGNLGLGGEPGGFNPLAALGGMDKPSIGNPFADNFPPLGGNKLSFEEWEKKNANGTLPKKQMPSFDIDALVKKIDAKIAELEEQERLEEEAKKNGTIPNSVPLPSNNDLNSSNLFGGMTTPKIEPMGQKDLVVPSLEDAKITPNEVIKDEYTPFIDKDAIINDDPINVPIINNKNVDIKNDDNEDIEKFEDIFNNQIKVESTLDNKPLEKPIEKPLGGIVDPTQVSSIVDDGNDFFNFDD